MAQCPQCGKTLRPGGNFCTQCGATVKSAETEPALKKEAHTGKGAQQVAPAEPASPADPANPINPDTRRGLNVKLLIKGLIKSLAMSILLLGPGFVLIFLGLSFPGMVLLFVGSFWMMARTYRRPWRLTRLSCFIPPLVALISYGMQLALFAEKELPWLTIALAVGAGILLGWWRGST
jgi:hypothetical protein